MDAVCGSRVVVTPYASVVRYCHAWYGWISGISHCAWKCVSTNPGVIVFPVTAQGKLAVAEGTVEAIPMTREKYVAWLEHLAEERGEKLDASTVGEGPFRILQLKGEGARIEGE